MHVDVTASGMNVRAVAESGVTLEVGLDTIGESTMHPIEIFLSSLGICVAAMLRKHCMSNGLDCGDIKVTVDGDFEQGAAMCQNLEVTVVVEGDWDERRKAAFLKVAETCPVHESIVNCGGVNIEVV